jgi:hypothetical protein
MQSRKNKIAGLCAHWYRNGERTALKKFSKEKYKNTRGTNGRNHRENNTYKWATPKVKIKKIQD